MVSVRVLGAPASLQMNSRTQCAPVVYGRGHEKVYALTHTHATHQTGARVSARRFQLACGLDAGQQPSTALDVGAPAAHRASGWPELNFYIPHTRTLTHTHTPPNAPHAVACSCSAMPCCIRFIIKLSIPMWLTVVRLLPYTRNAHRAHMMLAERRGRPKMRYVVGTRWDFCMWIYALSSGVHSHIRSFKEMANTCACPLP